VAHVAFKEEGIHIAILYAIQMGLPR
jgi:hypothetical protein